MKKWKIAAITTGILLAGVGVAMAATNPTQEAYEEFATGALIDYAGKNLCTKVPILGAAQCQLLLEKNQAEIRRFVAQGTQRQNFFLFSIYTTDLSISNWLPSYHFESVGVFQRFHVYKAQEEK